ncbi:hypothetical protein [Amycolatopsis sp. YIM 10]|uniref:hypothetical protein n=1 Tax=Amycolatopsis sp. YIM 10 TaxID=2653857 RepID=UPI0012900B03|nr:hypothetical protein [Amycolatopsis sp. YIM 10]QFU93924.1 hypothetical protein YIM_43950 [Amycolatopsis sp. YIM 10]
MSITDEVARMRERLEGLVREQADRRALRDRQAEEAKAKAQEYMSKQVQAAERYVDHRRELGRREKEAGGWATEKTLSDKSNVMGFGVEDEEDGPGFTGHAVNTAPPVTRAEPQPAAAWQAPPAPPVPEPVAVAEPAPAPAPRRAGRHARREESFDDDDFSNNSWMK